MAKKKITRTRSKNSNKSTLNSLKKTFPFKYFFIFAFVAVGALVFNQKTSQGSPSVLGVATSSYTSKEISWSGKPGLAGYNIYYKTDKDSKYTYAVRNLSGSSRNFTINYLVKNKVYVYEVKGYELSKKETWTSGPVTFTTPK